jgi:hypothetical protein
MSTKPRRLEATVDQVEGDVVVLDVEGEAVRLPRALLPGRVREGDGFVLTIARAPEVREKLQQSVEARLRALTGEPPPAPSEPAAPSEPTPPAPRKPDPHDH